MNLFRTKTGARRDVMDTEKPAAGTLATWKRTARHYLSRRSLLIVIGAVLIAIGWFMRPRADNSDVLRAAYAIKDGGGYCPLNDTGVARKIVFQGIRILPKSHGGNYYCCGYTFAIAMQVAKARGLLAKVEPYQISRFQREWYGSTAKSIEKEAVIAIEDIGIGHEVRPLDARPGDFVVFSRPRSGHSVIFLKWIKVQGRIVGLKYRSSQPPLGVGDRVENFMPTGGTIIPKYFFVGRLNP